MPLPKNTLPPLENNKPKDNEDKYTEEEKREREHLKTMFGEFIEDPEMFDKMYEDSKRINEFKMRESMRNILPSHTLEISDEERRNIKHYQRLRNEKRKKDLEDLYNN